MRLKKNVIQTSVNSLVSLDKAEAARLEQEGVGTPDEEALFASQEGVKRPSCSSRCSWMKPKAKAARSECEGDATSDKEALFAS